MKAFATTAALIAALTLLAVACGKDEESGGIRFDRPAVYVTDYGQSATVGFVLDNVQPNTLTVSSKPSGWKELALDVAAQTLSVTAPAAPAAETATSGSIVISGVPNGGGSVVSATLFVGIVLPEELEGPANSFLANRKETNYRFDAMRTGDSELATARVEVVWQSVANLVQFLTLDGDKASFYIGAENDKIKEGNAVIGAYDAQDNLIWSWHVWATDYDPETAGGTVDFNGYAMMDRNLGARANANATQDEILASYGLYYQWGRKDPFVGPSAYDASNGSSAAMYNGGGSRVYLSVAASDAATGTMDYALRNPSTFITTADKDADWLESGVAAAARWSSEAKSLCDPCPYGWRVAPAAAFDNLSIKENLDAAADYKSKFGWTLVAGGSESLFMGAGRRSWRDATVQNYFDDSLLARGLTMQPWVGYYWTADADGALAAAFCFWLKADEVAASGVKNARPMGRANGMQVRCVKER